jgi:hypothetical protein
MFEFAENQGRLLLSGSTARSAGTTTHAVSAQAITARQYYRGSTAHSPGAVLPPPIPGHYRLGSRCLQ